MAQRTSQTLDRGEGGEPDDEERGPDQRVQTRRGA